MPAFHRLLENPRIWGTCRADAAVTAITAALTS